MYAVGEFIDRAALRTVCVTEVADGVVVVGLAEEGRNVADLVLTPKTMTITNEQIARLLAEMGPRRGPRLFRR